RQVALAVEELEDLRKSRLRSMPAEQLATARRDQLMKACSRERSLGDNRLTVLVIGDLPALGIIAFSADRLVKDRPQAPPTPEVALENGPECEGIKRRHASHLTRINLARRRRIDT